MPAPLMPATALAVTTPTRRTGHGWPGNRRTVHRRAAHLRRALHCSRTVHLRTARHRALHTSSGPLHLRRAMRHGRPGIRNWLVLRHRARLLHRLVIHSRLVLHHWFVIQGGLMLVHRFMVHHRFMLCHRAVLHRWSGRHRRTVVRYALPPRMMPRRVFRRATHAVNMPRIMPMPAVPVRRSPAGHPATCRERRKGEHCCTAGRIPIHRLAIRITENRKTIHIIPGICPRSRGAPPRPAHPHRGARIHRIIIHRTGTQPQGCHQHHGYACHFFIHLHKMMVASETLAQHNSIFV